MNGGCGIRKCACRNWINCSYYNDLVSQAHRLSMREYRFQKWYDVHFRENMEMGFVGNG